MYVQKQHDKRIKKFGEKVKELRQKHGMTQLDLAGLCEVDRITIHRLENGLFAPGLRLIYSLADAFKVKAHELIE